MDRCSEDVKVREPIQHENTIGKLESMAFEPILLATREVNELVLHRHLHRRSDGARVNSDWYPSKTTIGSRARSRPRLMKMGDCCDHEASRTASAHCLCCDYSLRQLTFVRRTKVAGDLSKFEVDGTLAAHCSCSYTVLSEMAPH